MNRVRLFLSIPFAFIAAGVYATITRLVFGFKGTGESVFSTFSLGFLFLVPLALGALTVFFAPPKYRTFLLYVIFMPWVSSLVFVLLAALVAWEAWICVLMATPIFLLMSSAGGLLMALVFYFTRSQDATSSKNLALLFLIASPYIVTPFELRLPAPTSTRETHQQIEINASPETVWDNIVRLKIPDSDQRESFFHVAGLPRPVEASLSYAGVGGIRRGEWEYGLAFDGIITDWKTNERFMVQLKVDTRNVIPAAAVLKEIGGAHFDLVDDTYVIERVSANKVILHLYSTHRLTSQFNFYGGIWTDFFMRDIQSYILQMAKLRCESYN